MHMLPCDFTDLNEIELINDWLAMIHNIHQVGMKEFTKLCGHGSLCSSHGVSFCLPFPDAETRFIFPVTSCQSQSGGKPDIGRQQR